MHEVSLTDREAWAGRYASLERAWAPGSLFEQDGAASLACARGLLATVDGSLDEAGYQASVGHELEFFLVAPDGSALENTPWVP